MISDILQRRKMISVKISTRKKCIETDLKTFCKSWEEAGGNTRERHSVSDSVISADHEYHTPTP
jgi:hypothetical protein